MVIRSCIRIMLCSGILLLAGLLPYGILAQPESVGPSRILEGAFLGETPPLRDIPQLSDEEWAIMVEKAERKRLNPKVRTRSFPNAETALPRGADPVWQQQSGGSRESLAPLQLINGGDSPYFPSDANGTIGPEHYMQTINTIYTIYDRAGNLLAGPAALNFLFYGTAGSNYNDGDPIALYDEQADRWLMAAFSVSGDNDYLLIAVSTSNDPTGSWYKYSFDVADMPDYPKFGIWRDGYYVGTNTYGNWDIYVLQRSQMLAGLSPMGVAFDNPWRPGPSIDFHCVPPVDNDGTFAPEGSPGLFITLNDDAVGGGSDELWILELDVDWATPANSTLSRSQQIAVASFDSNFGTSWANITQPDTTLKLDAIPQVIMNPPQYRNFGDYETIVCCHTVDVNNTDRAGIRWYELRRSGGGPWTIRQQGTYAPDAHSRWLGSIMLNGSGELALGYSISSSTVYPGIRCTGQSSDAYAAASGTMDVPEEIIQNGLDFQKFTSRWGDYAAMQVDVHDDETFWFTSQYIGTGGTRKTRIATLQIGAVQLTANFTASTRNPARYATVTLNELNFGSPAARTWSIEPATFHFVNGTHAASPNPQVQFTEAGSYTISLTITGNGQSDTETKTAYILVSDCGAIYLPFNEDFAGGTMPACWKNVNNSVNNRSWQFTIPANFNVQTTTAYNGAAVLDSYNFGTGYLLNADLITPTLDLSDYTTVNLFFEHFFPYYSAYAGDYGYLYYSINDGASWTLKQSWFNSANGDTVEIDFTTQLAGQSRARLKWTYVGYGYYWAIDDLSITGAGPNTWTGAVSPNWNTAGNWSAGTVPGPASKVIIPETAANWPTFTGHFILGSSCDKITLYGSAQLNVSGNFVIPSGKTLAINGDATISISGDWICAGNFIPGSGTVKFTGSAPSAVMTGTTTTTNITNYQLSTFPKGMSNLTGYLTGPTGDDKSSAVDIGFTFNYLGSNYTQVRICTNGWLSLISGGNVTTADNTTLFNNTNPNLTLAPWFDDLEDDNNSIVVYKTEGTAPYRVFTAEWNSVLTYATNAESRISFQVKLFETTNIIEFHYGNLVSGTFSGSESASIGIENATGGSGNFIEATTGSTTAGVTNLKAQNNWPAVNYRFSPPSVNVPQFLSSLVIDKNGSSLSIMTETSVAGDLTISNGTLAGPSSSQGTLNVAGDWTNNGAFLPGATTVIFNGSSNQVIGGNAPTNLSSLTVSNPAGMILQNNLSVTGTLSLAGGAIDAGAHTLELGASATAPGTLTWTSGHILGSFKRWIAASTAAPVDFPVGTATTGHPARITFGNNTGGSLTARFEPGDPGGHSGFPVTDGTESLEAEDLYLEGSWLLTAASLSSTDYDLELSGTGFSSLGDPDETIRILKRPGGGGDWTADGSHVAGDPPLARREGLNGFSRFILAKPPNDGYKISGNITYYNAANTPIPSGVTVSLFRDGSQVGPDFLVTNGSYQFLNLPSGVYELRVSSSNPTEGSVNTTDAAQVNYWGALPYEIEKVRFYAGDVTGSTHFINSTDALRIQGHFVNGTAPDKGPWMFWVAGQTISTNSSPEESYPTVTLGSSNLTANIYALCAGDFNRSFVPGGQQPDSPALSFNHADTLFAGPSEVVDLPITLSAAEELTALSLILEYPGDLAGITGVTVHADCGHAEWSATGNELRISWISDRPVQMASQEILVTLRLRTTGSFVPGSEIRFSPAPDPHNELAGPFGRVISGARLSVPVLRVKV